MFKFFVSISMLLCILGCDEGRQMMQPAIPGEPPIEEITPVEQTIPVTYYIEGDGEQQTEIAFREGETVPITYFIDGFEHQQRAYTSVEAALDSDQFQILLKITTGYNDKYCGKQEKALLGMDIYLSDGTSLPADYFAFRTQAEAQTFAQRAVNEYEELGNYSFIEYREEFPWWYAILQPRCF